MPVKLLLQSTQILSAVLALATLTSIFVRRQLGQYKALSILLTVHVLFRAVQVPLLYHRSATGLPLKVAYPLYFDCYWGFSVLETLLEVGVIYGAYRVAMKPLEGLQKMGRVIFYWIASVSVMLSLVLFFGPHAISENVLATLLGRVQEAVSILTLCLLLFVCFAARPLGLTYRSRTFGVILGLGVQSSVVLVMSAWLSTYVGQSLYSPLFLVGSTASVLTHALWFAYMALPEPERVMILVPTTSPYHHWNSISKALNDAPGVVAVAGFRPSMLAAAEVSVMVEFGKQERRAEQLVAARSKMLPESLAVGAR